jgi:hypothetical protein
MKDAGSVILAFGIILLGLNFKGNLSVGNVNGAAAPVMIVVGAIMMFV